MWMTVTAWNTRAVRFPVADNRGGSVTPSTAPTSSAVSVPCSAATQGTCTTATPTRRSAITTGYQKSVSNLSWSYASLLSAIRARTAI